ncbi:hypothetical protein TCAL_12071 [Tigriopus californicus]|uniref:Dipeptidyl peptidase 9 n=1 Tax=Tigriopus californicus TaxID=6832 RepID=A0A553NUS8_TIGCA|nr:dipeptidyl peptidase 9-like [Tigriopus californicus]TRY69188.1 hypothetical protein TCAL_12071 [Tigriopus californicus]|eukprot:TCALIF_12071-PA protein Name:"Similar to DPP9 Dipeptidyl peptidase 9 (Homo sapiens)" AED:0.03 eAED:0.03 QI:175/1/1/1/0.9/0.81/11/4043/935
MLGAFNESGSSPGSSLRESSAAGSSSSPGRSSSPLGPRHPPTHRATDPPLARHWRTWAELRNAVRDARRAFVRPPASYSTLRTPTGFTFRRWAADGGGRRHGRTRLYFVASLVPAKESTLLYVDLDDGRPSAETAPLTWHPLIESTFRLLPMPGQISKEEQLLLERKRSVSWGLTQYEVHVESGRFVFPAAGSLYGCLDPGGSSSSGRVSPNVPLYPYEIKSFHLHSRLNPVLSPTHPDWVAFVGQGDLYVGHPPSGLECRLTHVHLGRSALAEDPLTVGLPSYVMQEEFNRYTGFWWRPFSHNHTFWILYEEVDESEVDLLRFAQSHSPEVEEFRFPRPGTNNAKSTLRIVQFTVATSKTTGSTVIEDVVHLSLKDDLQESFPYLEYIVRAGWTPNGDNIWVQLLNRKQQLLELVAISFDSFGPVNLQPHPKRRRSSPPSPSPNGVRGGDSWRGPSNGVTPTEMYPPHPTSQLPIKFQVLYTRRSDTWILVNDILTFLPSRYPSNAMSSEEIEFIMASEEANFTHLYHVVASLKHSNQSGSSARSTDDEKCLRPSIISKVPLTSGNWCVVDKQIWVDHKHDLVYFMGLKDTPLEKHLYVVSLYQPGHIRRLTTPNFSHSVTMSGDCSLFVTVFSSIESVPACQVFRISHGDSSVESISLNPMGWILQPKSLDCDYQCPEIFSHEISSGDLIYGMIFKPYTIKPGVRYPVILNIYGGPEVQLVTNTFKGMRQMRNHLLASQGYCVICIDSRGSWNRGSSFAGHLRLRMGQVELSDQVEVLKWVLENSSYMDMTRVAIHGWSYGGYLSLMGLIQYPKLFKVSIAGAPVTTWMNYDTGYTERYMDLPASNPDGYKLGSVLNHASEFPNEPNRLLIVHGLMDENVHFAHHTSQLVTQLVRFGKPYDLKVYPCERHSLRHLESSEHYETTLLNFLQDNL